MTQKIYFTPGPSQLFYTFKTHFNQALLHDIPSLPHRSKSFMGIVAHTTVALRELLQVPEEFDIFFLNSANEAWDRLIQNLVIERSHHFVNGALSKKFFEFARMHGMKSTSTEVPDGAPFPNLNVPGGSELIGITKNETSVGYTFCEDEIGRIRNENLEAIIALDIVSASPSIPIDFSNIDSAYFSVQKGFGLPPGLAVWICNQRCQEKASIKASKTSIGSYRTLSNLKKFGDQQQTPETPNTVYIYILGKVAEDMIRIGQQKIINDTIYKSTLLYQAIEKHPLLTPFVLSKNHRSPTTVVGVSDHSVKIISCLKEKGIIIGKGYGAYQENHIRMANFPTHSKEMVEMLFDRMMKIV